MPAFNYQRFLSICALMDRPGTEGERATALGKAETIAGAAGLTVEAARKLSEGVMALDATWGNAWMERETQRLWQEAHKQTANERQEAEAHARRKAEAEAWVIAEYGSVESLWEESQIERELEDAVARAAPGSGWDRYSSKELPSAVRRAVERVKSLPDTLSEAWAEWQSWEKLMYDRWRFDHHYERGWGVEARQALLQSILDTQPAGDLCDARIRLAYLEHVRSRDTISYEQQTSILARLREDLEATSTPRGFTHEVVHSGRRTNADKRRDVLSILDTVEGARLTDRAIARRVFVSPQTVNNIRRQRRSEAHPRPRPPDCPETAHGRPGAS